MRHLCEWWVSRCERDDFDFPTDITWETVGDHWCGDRYVIRAATQMTSRLTPARQFLISCFLKSHKLYFIFLSDFTEITHQNNFTENAILKKWARPRSVTLNIFVQQVDSIKVFFIKVTSDITGDSSKREQRKKQNSLKVIQVLLCDVGETKREKVHMTTFIFFSEKIELFKIKTSITILFQ